MKTFMFVILAALLVIGSSLAVAQQQDLHPYTADIAATGLVLAVGGTDYTGLAGGTCYTAVADPAGVGTLIDPFTGGEGVAQTASAITGDPFANVVVSILMPTILTDGVYIATMSYDGTSACWSNDGEATYSFFNPQGTTNTMNLGAGQIDIFLAGNICVPRNTGATNVTGSAVISVQYQ